MSRKLILLFISLCFVFIGTCQKANAQNDSVMTIKELIVKHAYELNLDPALALSIAKTESNFCHNKKSRYGAVGVFQLMPSTAKKMGFNPYHLQENIKGGITYYKKMYNMFGSTELALAAYNAGPGNVKKYKGIPPFTETKRFIASTMTSYNHFKANSDPVIQNYSDKFKEINNYTSEDGDSSQIQQEAIIQAFLSSQGV